MSDNKNNLVSIVVITYNSESTVIETLDSIKSQDYEAVELIITDDCSKDATVELCENWLVKNGNVFTRSLIINSKINTGTAANINRGVHASKGEWIKIIAGDDLLKQNSISSYVDFALKKQGEIYCSDCEVFTSDGDVPHDVIVSYERFFRLVNEPQTKQLRRIASDYVIPGPALFFSRHLYNQVGGYDERFGLAEEVPFAFKVLKLGYEIIPINQKLIRYRYSTNSVSHTKKRLSNRKWFDDSKGVFYAYQYPELIRTKRYLKAYEKVISYYSDELEYKQSIFTPLFIKFLDFINPRYYRNAIIKTKKLLRIN